MEMKEILSKVDHTLLKPESTWEQIKEICDDGMKYETASVCIPPSFVKQAAEYVEGKLPICTVIGFPNGYNLSLIHIYRRHFRYITYVRANQARREDGQPQEVMNRTVPSDPRQPDTRKWHFRAR